MARNTRFLPATPLEPSKRHLITCGGNRLSRTRENGWSCGERLNGVAGFSIAEAQITKRPSIRLAALANGSALTDFLAVMVWLVIEIKKYSAVGETNIPD